MATPAKPKPKPKPKPRAKPKPKRGDPTTAGKAQQEVAITARRAQVAALALTYVPQNKIASQLGVSTATISTDLKAIKGDWLAEAKADIQTAMVVELNSLDRIETQLWAQFLSTEQRMVRHFDDKGQVIREQLINFISPAEKTRSALAILRVKERRAKMLGFDSPDMLDVSISVEQLVAMRDELRAELGYDGPKAVEAS